MAESTSSLLEFLEQLRKERDEANSLIAAIERRLGIGGETAPSTGGTQDQTAATPRVRVSIDSIPVGFFHNMSQVQATEKLLRLNPGQPLSTNEIIDAFRKSGMEVNPKNGSTILYTSLIRSEKFERVAGKAWGLSDWYPERRKDKRSEEPNQPESKSPAKIKRRYTRSRPIVRETPPAATPSEASPPKKDEW